MNPCIDWGRAAFSRSAFSREESRMRAAERDSGSVRQAGDAHTAALSAWGWAGWLEWLECLVLLIEVKFTYLK